MNIPRLILALVSSFIIWIIINQYFICPKFSFKTSPPFSGESFYNPYESSNENDWVKCNFHAHTNAWYGLTNGKGTAADIYHAYDSMNYAVHCVSDYQTINTSFSSTPGYIPAYEHGFNINKTHQLVLGSNKVLWLDYPFSQSLSNKQNILNRLSSDTESLIIINHPGDRSGYTTADLKYLTNYDCIEALSPYAISLAHWDSALSSGHRAFIVGDDDVHDVFCKDCLAVMCTWVNVPSVKKSTVLNALKTGKSYGMMIGKSTGAVPKLKHLEVANNTVSIVMSETAQQIIFTGQYGKVLAVDTNTASSKYIIKPEDHYIRTTIEYEGGLKIFLNPVFRYDKTETSNQLVSINAQKTFVFRLMGILLLVVWLSMAFLFALSKPNRSRILKRKPTV